MVAENWSFYTGGLDQIKQELCFHASFMGEAIATLVTASIYLDDRSSFSRTPPGLLAPRLCSLDPALMWRECETFPAVRWCLLHVCEVGGSRDARF